MKEEFDIRDGVVYKLVNERYRRTLNQKPEFKAMIERLINK